MRAGLNLQGPRRPVAPKVVGFALFVITGCGNPSIQGDCTNTDGKYVNGTFVAQHRGAGPAGRL
jgi:hypothetical protein